MTTRRDEELMRLAERVEAEEPSQRFWREIWCAVYPEGNPRGMQFAMLCDHGAYRDAAAMLMPSGWFIESMYVQDENAIVRLRDDEYRFAREGGAHGPHAMARAWLAANLRAHAADRDKGGDRDQ